MWGLGPGALSAVIPFLALNYYFIPPYYTLVVHRNKIYLVLIVFLGVFDHHSGNWVGRS